MSQRRGVGGQKSAKKCHVLFEWPPTIANFNFKWYIGFVEGFNALTTFSNTIS